jgi:hypothetical protein
VDGGNTQWTVVVRASMGSLSNITKVIAVAVANSVSSEVRVLMMHEYSLLNKHFIEINENNGALALKMVLLFARVASILSHLLLLLCHEDQLLKMEVEEFEAKMSFHYSKSERLLHVTLGCPEQSSIDELTESI